MSVFVDSTTLLYPLDQNEKDKGTVCETWLSAIRLSNMLVLNPQALNETQSIVLRKSRFANARPLIREYLRSYFQFCISPLTGPVAMDAAWALQDRYRIPWWDSLLLASANEAGCAYFLSEDLNDGQVYGGVTVVNPFRHSPQDVLGRALP
ncbi:PIN domain-containing protein [soil metagenome]